MSFVWKATHPVIHKERSLDAEKTRWSSYQRELIVIRILSGIATVIAFMVLAHCSSGI